MMIPGFTAMTEGIPEKQTELITYNITNSGLYMTKKISGGGTITLKIDDKVKINLPDGKESINFLKRKIPFTVFWDIVKFFKYVREHHNSTLETFAIIGYSNTEDKYCIWIPEHKVTVVSVNYNILDFSKEYPGYYMVADVHSHPGGGANFSGVDNEDDNRDRFSIVIGNLDSVMPSYKIRFSANGKFWDITLNDIFTSSEENFIKINTKEDIKKISLPIKQSEGSHVQGITTRAWDINRGVRSNDWLGKYISNIKEKEQSVGEILGNTLGEW